MRANRELHKTQDHLTSDFNSRVIPWDQMLIVLVIFLVLSAFAAIHHKRDFSTLLDRQTADVAQVSRNIAEGNGFVTRMVRPFNVSLMSPDTRMLPEINHAPLYPYALALSFRAQGISSQTVARTSLVFLILTAAATCLLGWVIFNLRVGLLAASVVALSAPVLQIAGTGQQWMMGAMLFTLLITCIAKYRLSMDDEYRQRCGLWLGLSAAAMAALYYFSYPMAILALPVAGYFALIGDRRWLHPIVFLAVFTLLATPAFYRNYQHTGSPVLGGSTWDLMASTTAFPGDNLYRTTDTTLHTLSSVVAFPISNFSAFSGKLVSGSIQAVQTLIPMLGWLALPFAITSVLYAYKDRHANSIRGLLYVLSASVVGVVALYIQDSRAIVTIAPAIAVYACAYLVLLIKSKRMPDEYRNWLVGGFVIVTVTPTLAALAWPGLLREEVTPSVADRFFADNSANMAPGSVIYTDVPWTASWRTLSVAVWLPMKDEDVYTLNASDFPMRAIVLTPESDTYSEFEIWHMLHRVPLWREYVRDPDAGVARILAAGRISGEAAERAKQSLQRFQRGFTVSETIAGFQAQILDPLSTEEIQVLLAPRDR